MTKDLMHTRNVDLCEAIKL